MRGRLLPGPAALPVRLAAGRIEFRQGRREPLPRGFTLGRVGSGINQRLDERGVAHIEELARLVQLESRFADVPVGVKLDVGPCTGRARLAAELRGETLAVGLEPAGVLMPASSAKVAWGLAKLTMSSSTFPLGVTAGQLAISGTRDPPSSMLPFQPLIMRPRTGLG